MKCIKISIFTLILFSALNSNAQYVKDYRIEADKAYERGDWQTAANYYEKFLSDKKGPRGNNEDVNPYSIEASPEKKGTPEKPAVVPKKVSLKLVKYRIAECYRHLDNYKNAEPWYGKVVNEDKASYPQSQYFHAVCLRALGKNDEAEKEFASFLETYTTEDDYKKKATSELANLKFTSAEMKNKKSKLFVVNKMADNFNTTEHGQNTAPFVSNKNLYFTSSRPDSVIVKKKKVALFQNKLYSGNGTSAEKVNFPSVKNKHRGAFTFTPDGNSVYFNQWDLEDMDAKTIAIFKSTKGADGNWSEGEKVAGDIHVDGYTSKQPMLTLDGKNLMYVSNKPGGQGGFDIWYASLDGDKLGASKNMGAIINSSNNEITPFYHAPSKSLVFANEGRVGLGGYDLYYSKGNIGEDNWSEPTNMGYPINSQKNDEYFFNDDEKFLMKNFYLSSDRGSDCCLELYTANKLIKKWVSGKVINSKTGEPLSDVVINITDDKGNKIPTTTTDKNGNYFFESDPYNRLVANANKEAFESSANLITSDFNIDTLMRADWALTPIPPPPPPIITEDKPLIVRFEFNKSDITQEFSSYLDTLAAMMDRDKTMEVEIGGYTDKLGTDEYNMKLSQSRADAAKEYMIKKYNTDAARLTTQGYGECCPVEEEKDANGKDNPDARKMNRRLEFKLKKK